MSDPTKKKLFQIYNLSDLLNAALDMLEGNPALSAEELDALLGSVTADLNSTVEEVGLAIRNNQARINAKEAEVLRLKEACETEEAQNDRLKKALMAMMDRANITKVKGNLLTVSIRNNGGVLPITIEGDPADLPESFRKEKVVYSLNREAVEQAKELGVDLPAGVVVQPRGRNLQIT